MKTRMNRNGTVSVSQMPKELYYAVLSVLGSAQRSFEWNDEENEWWSNSDFICTLSPEEKEALDKINWIL